MCASDGEIIHASFDDRFGYCQSMTPTEGEVAYAVLRGKTLCDKEVTIFVGQRVVLTRYNYDDDPRPFSTGRVVQIYDSGFINVAWDPPHTHYGSPTTRFYEASTFAEWMVAIDLCD